MAKKKNNQTPETLYTEGKQNTPFGRRLKQSKGIDKPKPTIGKSAKQKTPRKDSKPISSPVVVDVKPVERPGSKLAAALKSEKTSQPTARVANAPHLMIDAKAGSGKTTTLIEGLKYMRGIKSDHPAAKNPSDQQKAIWESLKDSGNCPYTAFVAYTNTIADELSSRVPPGCEAMTTHRMGFRAIRENLRVYDVKGNRTEWLLSGITGKRFMEMRTSDPAFVSGCVELTRLARLNLVEPTPQNLSDLARHHDIETAGAWDRIVNTVPILIEKHKLTADRCVDFTDQIWLPVALNLPIFRHNMLMIDEAQDLNRCQHELTKRAGERLVYCGDPNQAIFGFAGADSDSMPRLQRELTGCQVFPLTYTRRCGKAIVAEANQFVKDFHAFPTNHEGAVTQARLHELSSLPKPGDMIVCRVNAPLVNLCFKLLAAGIKAEIKGRDIGQLLVKTITSMKADNVPNLLAKLEEWRAAELAKENALEEPSETRKQSIVDRVECIRVFCEGKTEIKDVIAQIDAVFTNTPDVQSVLLCSIHKAKGLEAKRVFFLRIKGANIPNPRAVQEWQIQQEYNLMYVAITRAIEELTYVFN